MPFLRFGIRPLVSLDEPFLLKHTLERILNCIPHDVAGRFRSRAQLLSLNLLTRKKQFPKGDPAL